MDKATALNRIVEAKGTGRLRIVFERRVGNRTVDTLEGLGKKHERDGNVLSKSGVERARKAYLHYAWDSFDPEDRTIDVNIWDRFDAEQMAETLAPIVEDLVAVYR